jgi:predicted nuclease of predicted toxin-antitoxin system
MKFLLDSCVSKFAVNELQAAGMDVNWIPEMGPDPGDEAILEMALKEDRVLVTIDKDFGDLVFVFDRPHPAIIRLVDIRANKQGEGLMQVVKSHKEDIERKALITVDGYRIRVRLPEGR